MTQNYYNQDENQRFQIILRNVFLKIYKQHTSEFKYHTYVSI